MYYFILILLLCPCLYGNSTYQSPSYKRDSSKHDARYYRHYPHHYYRYYRPYYRSFYYNPYLYYPEEPYNRGAKEDE